MATVSERLALVSYGVFAAGGPGMLAIWYEGATAGQGPVHVTIRSRDSRFIAYLNQRPIVAKAQDEDMDSYLSIACI
jgi:hypothetical protein